jgi:small subunit ribosomal protein S5
MINNLNSSDKGKNTNRVRRNKKPQEKTVRWEQRLVQIQRVSKVVKGGKKLSFRATVIVGNQNSQVGVGVGKADEVSTAVKKAVNNARKKLN